jgi:hypothetical protein
MSGVGTLPNQISSNAFTQTEAMLTPEQLKARYLFGIDLTDSNGNELPLETIQHQINTAISYLQHKLDICITPARFLERYDYRAVDYTEFNLLHLKKRPAAEVHSLKAKLANSQELIDYPPEWFVLEKESGQLQLSPSTGSYNSIVTTSGGAYAPLMYGSKESWPHLFEVDYTAGFCADQIPVIINDMIGLQASIGIFEILGDIVLGPGVASESVGLDGASVGKTLTASAMYSAYSARIDGYRKKLKDYVETVRKYYNGFQFVVP